MHAHTGQNGGDRRFADLPDLDIAASRSGWLLTALCLAYAALALYLQPGRYLYLSQSYAQPFLLFLPALLAAGLGVVGLTFARPNPTRFMLDTLKRRWLAAAPVILLFFLCVTAFTTFKITIPDIVPFYADPMLAELDLQLHGTDPWAWAHGIVSEPVSAVIFGCYGFGWLLQWFGILLFVAFWNSPARRLRYLWAFALTTVLCGTVLATVLSSAGPIFFDQLHGGDRFAGLQTALAHNGFATSVHVYADYLLAAYQSGRPQLGGGISAMPSMHVAIATLNAFFLTGFGRRWAAFGWSFAALILFGSVYTGWHYAVDGYLSILVVSLLWYLTGRFVLSSRDTVDIGLAAPEPALRQAEMVGARTL
ncbi:MAG: phosphatase PAP2 family protein [Mesorhizobium sp.]|uniref:phosphatase PAP2 family protein n=1 Tax=Mesorhizobium sp. TaxID=1871066 RepID=UPI001AD5FF87|nr:phosphatase PAP2 family protein [Mesorhizobium sp.]MBN9216614.1 phosphatase PAP2 family protein [Mesorhizobium sp.]